MATASTKKVLVSIWEPLLLGISKRASDVGLRRDSFLDAVLKTEATYLDEEMPAPNASRVQRHLQRQLDLLKRKPTTLTLSKETAEFVTDVCERKAVPRDCFINRVLFLLVANRSALDLILNSTLNDHREDVHQRGVPDPGRLLVETPSELFSEAAAAFKDPLAFVRCCIEMARERDRATPALHMTTIPQKLGAINVPSLLGLNCHLDEVDVEGTEAWKQQQVEVQALLAEFEAVPSEPPKPKKRGKRSRT